MFEAEQLLKSNGNLFDDGVRRRMARLHQLLERGNLSAAISADTFAGSCAFRPRRTNLLVRKRSHVEKNTSVDDNNRAKEFISTLGYSVILFCK